MEVAGYEDNESQILYRKTKKQISNLQAKLAQHKETKQKMIEIIDKRIVYLKEQILLPIGENARNQSYARINELKELKAKLEKGK